jgi:hypothetical protein
MHKEIQKIEAEKHTIGGVPCNQKPYKGLEYIEHNMRTARKTI